MATGQDSRDSKQSQINAGDEYFELCCNSCSTLNKQAVKYCITCMEYLCVKCVERHSKKSSSHALVDPRSSSTSPNGSKPKFHDVPTELCKKHPQEVVNMYCGDEDKVGCIECFKLDHKTCEDINYIPKYVLSDFSSEQIQQINRDLRKAIIVTSRLMTQQRSLSTGRNLEKNKDICRKEIQKYREEINHHIDKLEAATLAELDAEHDMIKHKIDDMKQHIQDLHDEMVRLKAEIETDDINDSQKFVIAKLSQCVISQGQELTPKLLSDQTKGLTFTRNTDIMAFLWSIDTLGKRSPPEMQTCAPILPTTKTQISPQRQHTVQAKSRNKTLRNVPATTEHCNNTKAATTPQRQVVYKVKATSQYNIKELRDTNKCNVCSTCILENGDILLADQSNCKIKLVDSSTYNVKATRKLEAKPWSVNKGRGLDAAAVCLHNDTILLVSPDTLDKKHTLSMKHKCRAIIFIRNRTYVSDYKTIYIYTLHGKLLKTINKYKSGKFIFSCIHDMTVSDDEKMIHVADRCHGVITLNTDGNVIRRFSGRLGADLRGANGVCTDGSDNVIVCGNMTHNVIQLAPDGHYIGEIVPCGNHMKSPLTVCFDRNNHKLIVGNFEDNTILVFTVQ